MKVQGIRRWCGYSGPLCGEGIDPDGIMACSYGGFIGSCEDAKCPIVKHCYGDLVKKEERAQAEPCGRFFIVSWKRTNTGGPLVVFWRPGSCGYTTDLDLAGRFEEGEIPPGMPTAPVKLEPTLSSFAVPCSIVEAGATRVVQVCVASLSGLAAGRVLGKMEGGPA